MLFQWSKKNGIGLFRSTYPLEATKKSFSIYYDIFKNSIKLKKTYHLLIIFQ
jgi:hypothetical protein